MKSIKRYLHRTITLTLLTGAGLAITAAYFTSQHEMDEMFDAELAKFSRIVSGLHQGRMDNLDYRRIARQLNQPKHPARYYTADGQLTPVDPTAQAQAVRYYDEERMISIGFWNSAGHPRVLDGEWHDNGPFPAPTESGYRWQEYDGQSWRVFSMPLPDDEGWISIGLRKKFERELARKIALSNTLPYVIAIPLLALLIGMLVLRGLQPLERLSRQVSRRHHKALDPITEQVPLELEPLREALNTFMSHLHTTLERERRFTSDAAHELRTPLASVKIHLDNARVVDPEARQSLSKAYQGIERLQRVVEQLLTLARLDHTAAQRQERINLYPLAAQLAGELWPWADSRQQQLVIDGEQRIEVTGNATEIGVLIRNLLDNALRYSPPGTTVTLSLHHTDSHAILDVLDEGPGVPEDVLPKMTERFFRQNHQHMSGSGLGLSIVSTLARQQGADLSFFNREEGGLCARMAWPLAALEALTPQAV